VQFVVRASDGKTCTVDWLSVMAGFGHGQSKHVPGAALGEYFFSPMARQSPSGSGQGFLIVDASLSHSDTSNQ